MVRQIPPWSTAVARSQRTRPGARRPGNGQLPRWVTVVAIGLVLIATTACRSSGSNTPPDGVMSFEVTSADHTLDNVNYPQTPPVGGPHAPAWQNCGFYDSPIRNENGVHSLEHGAVWITFRPDLPQDQIDRLRQLGKNQTYVLVSPFPNLPAPVVASAWGRQLRLDSASDPRLEQFIRAFRQGPTAPERAPCTGGIGNPAS